MPSLFRPAGGGWLVAVLACLVLGGCQPADEGIKTYKVATPEQKQKTPDQAVPDGPPKVRFLGAVIPVTNDKAYFVRFAAPLDIEKIDPHEKDFDAFVNSIRVPGEGGKPISWTVPAGWKEVATPPVVGGGFVVKRTVTIQKSDGSSQELYISEPTFGTPLSNVNRWRTDFVGIKSVTPAELPTATKEIMLGTTKAYRVDFRGPGGKPKGPFMGGG
jgi:hypothetical protein